MASDKRDRTERLTIILQVDELGVIDDFRFKARMPSRSAAVRESCFAADWHRRRGASTSEAAAAMYELIEVIPKKIWGQVSILEPAYMVDDIGEQCCHD